MVVAKSRPTSSFSKRIWLALGMLVVSGLVVWWAVRPVAGSEGDPPPPIVFVARSHLATPDVIFGDEVGPAGQFGTGIPKFAPESKLVRRNTDGSLFVYNTPGLIDIQSPDVSFDAQTIIFAGTKTLDEASADYGWRLYEINVNGSGFKQLTFSDRSITIPNGEDFLTEEEYEHYDDLFPAYMADGRIVFNSSRYPTRAHYDQRRTLNIYIMNGDGSGMRRVTTERASVLHPTPLPDGRILASRWWNQFNQPSNEGIFNRIDNSDTNVTLPDGTIILANPDTPFNPPEGILPGGQAIRKAPNTWHLMTVNPDGTSFQRHVWTPRYFYAITNDSGSGDTYAAAQPAVIEVDGETFIAYTAQADQTMVHSTQNTGIRVGRPGIDYIYANTTQAIAGLTYDSAYGGNYDPPYALHPWGLPDGRILYSQSMTDNGLPTTGTFSQGGHTYQLQGSDQQYRLYVMDIDGGNKVQLTANLNSIGMATADMMDAKPIIERIGWESIPDLFASVPTEDPVAWNVPNDYPEYSWANNPASGLSMTTIHNPNVYANASLLRPFVNNSPPPGSVATVEVWLDANQFTGARCYNGYPQPCDDFRPDNQVRAVLWGTAAVSLAGEFTIDVPADVMSFIILRDAQGQVVRSWKRGYISIAQGSAWGRPGETVTCVGCHMGHVSETLADVMLQSLQGKTNVAPYASVSASSEHEETNQYRPFDPNHVNDRRGWIPVPAGGPQPEGPYADDSTGWMSAHGNPVGEWVNLAWPNEMTIESIRLVGPPPLGGDWDGFGEPAQYGDYYVESARIELFRAGVLVETIEVGRIEPMESTGGTIIYLAQPTTVDQLRFTVLSTTGRWYWAEVAALNEIEVIGYANGVTPPFAIQSVYLPMGARE